MGKLQEKLANMMMGYGGNTTTHSLSGQLGAGASPGTMSYAEGGIIMRPAKIIAGENEPEAIIPIREEYMKMKLRDILETLVQRRQDAEESQQQTLQASEELTDIEMSPAASSLNEQNQKKQPKQSKIAALQNLLTKLHVRGI